jgi:hypothetical protein
LALCVEADLLSQEIVKPVQDECLALLRILSTIIKRCQTTHVCNGKKRFAKSSALGPVSTPMEGVK